MISSLPMYQDAFSVHFENYSNVNTDGGKNDYAIL